MQRSIVLLVLLLLVGSVSAAIAREPMHPNRFYWMACAIGIQQMCPILYQDASGGIAEAQYQLSLLIWTTRQSEDDAVRAVQWMHEAAKQAYPAAVRLMEPVYEAGPDPRKSQPRMPFAPQRSPQRPFPAPPPVVAKTG